MALLINKTGLKKGDGSDLPATGILVKFIYQTEWDGYNVNHFLRYYTSQQSKQDGFDTINILVPQEGSYTALPTQFTKQLNMDAIVQYRQTVNQLMPTAEVEVKTIFTHHLFVKEFLENILGNNTVEVRIDLS